MEAALLDILRLGNPWLEDPGSFASAAAHRVPGNYVPRIVRGTEDRPVPRKAHPLVGARQVGKSTWLWSRFIAGGVPPLFLDAQEPAVAAWSRSPTRMRADLKEAVRAHTPVFLDEAQAVPEAGLCVICAAL